MTSVYGPSASVSLRSQYRPGLEPGPQTKQAPDQVRGGTGQHGQVILAEWYISVRCRCTELKYHPGQPQRRAGACSPHYSPKLCFLSFGSGNEWAPGFRSAAPGVTSGARVAQTVIDGNRSAKRKKGQHLFRCQPFSKNSAKEN